jgi:hypothetical protein
MTRTLGRALLLLSIFGSGASADSRKDGPLQIEFGVNTRHFAAADPSASNVAFRSSEQPDASIDAGTALTSSIRFTGKSRYNTFLGVEGEVGELLGYDRSNIAGAYGVVGMRGAVGPRMSVAAELVAGRRWVRYEIVGREDDSKLIAEPRVRADLWLSPRWTFGGAAGATLGDRSVWMAGLYFGLHSNDFDR